MYQNTNTNRAIRDFNQMLISMPEQRSMRDYRSAMARGEDLKSQAAMKQAEMAMPAMKLQSQEAQDKLDIYNSPFHASQIFGNVGGDLGKKGFALANTPDKGIMWTQEQKELPGIGQVPPAYQQAIENIERYHGYKLTKDGVFVNSKGDILPNRLAGPILNEARRIQSLNTDPIKARDNRVALLQDAVKSGKLSDDDAKRAQAEIDGLSKTDEVSLREAYLNRLNQWKAEDEQFGRKSKLMDPMINEQVQKIAELKGRASEQSRRQFELDKIDRKAAHDKQIELLKKKDLSDKDFGTFVSGMASNALTSNGIFGDSKTGYWRDGGLDEAGEPIKIGANAEAGQLMKQAEARATVIRQYAKKAGVSLYEASLEYDMQEARRRASEEQAAKDAQELRGRGGAYDPNAMTAGRSGQVEQPQPGATGPDFSAEGAENPITQGLMDVGSSWTFGKSAQEIAAEMAKRRR